MSGETNLHNIIIMQITELYISNQPQIPSSDVIRKEGNQRLRQGITKHQLRANNEDLKVPKAISLYRQRMSTRHTLGVSPLKNAVGPSSRNRSFTTTTPETLRSKLAFWIRVFIVSSGAAIVIDATAPAIEAMKFCAQVALE